MPHVLSVVQTSYVLMCVFQHCGDEEAYVGVH